MDTPIQLIVGLGNPGTEYAQTRHNAGAWFVEALLAQAHAQLRFDAKLLGHHGQIDLAGHTCKLLVPNTYMNHSGQAVQAFAHFYRIPPHAILIAHDELDLPVGAARLKWQGGHGGHNGLRNIIAHLSTSAFYRLRLGIGHPGSAKLVLDYVLKKPAVSDKAKIDDAIIAASAVMPLVVQGKWQQAMHTLHSQENS